MKERVCIIGGGVSGITTGLTLQLLGIDSTIYAEHLVEEQTPDDPRFASLYPAASIIPHSVQSGKFEDLFPVSQRVFEKLYAQQSTTGVFKHRHYELFEQRDTPPPSYAGHLMNYRTITSADEKRVPHRPETDALSGWGFDCFFTEWPTYIRELYRWYQDSGGQIIRKKVKAGDFREFNSDIVVNCTGIWSPDLFEDSEPRRVSRGHLIHIRDAPMIQDTDRAIPSYNYTAGSSVYADPEGNAADVYFYPRTNGWIIGGSRQPGVVDTSGDWTGKQNSDTIPIGGLQVPRQIYSINREIIQETYGIDLSEFSDLSAKAGYRYVRTQEGQGLRLEKTVEHGKTVIHNYGHGGAGVTLSWGCALYVAQIIEQENNPSLILERLTKDLMVAIFNQEK